MTTKLEGATQRVRRSSRVQSGYNGFLPVGLIKTPSQLTTGTLLYQHAGRDVSELWALHHAVCAVWRMDFLAGFVIRVDTYTCVLTSRQCLPTARQADSSLIIFVRDVGSKAQAAADMVVSCNLKPKVR